MLKIELTDRERVVMPLMELGLSNVEIGKRLDLSPNTVRAHIANIFKKLKAGGMLRVNRVKAVNWYRGY